MAEDFGAAEPATARLFDSGRVGQMFGWAAANAGADFVLSAGVGHDGHTDSGVFGRIGWGSLRRDDGGAALGVLQCNSRQSSGNAACSTGSSSCA